LIKAIKDFFLKLAAISYFYFSFFSLNTLRKFFSGYFSYLSAQNPTVPVIIFFLPSDNNGCMGFSKFFE